MGFAQLTELRQARGSPDNGTKEDQCSLAFPPVLMKIQYSPICSGQSKAWQFFTEGGTGRMIHWHTRTRWMP